MAIISDEDRTHLREHFAQEMEGEVRLVFFTQHESVLTIPGQECQYCEETRNILEELSQLHDKISLEVHDFVTEADLARSLGIDKVPAIVIQGKAQGAVRFFGIPSGYEFSTLVEDITDVSRGSTELSQDTKTRLSRLDQDLHLQVFVTPTCPYCPMAARLAHQMAVESPRVAADVVEAIEFPHLSQKYRVMGVPRTVANEDVHIEGALPEGAFVERVLVTAAKKQR